MKTFIEKIFIGSKITEEEILKELERAHNKYEFPPSMLNDEHSAYARGRLSAFRSEKEWLIVFELLRYVAEADIYENAIYCYGNKVKRRLSYASLFKLRLMNDYADPLDFEIISGSVKRHFYFNREDYLKTGIDLNKSISGDPIFDGRLNILRMWATILPVQEVFLSSADLLAVIGRPTTLPLLIQQLEWHHPDSRLPNEKFLTPCLLSLIKAIAHNDPKFYVCPSNLFNTHWSNWPAYGFK